MIRIKANSRKIFGDLVNLIGTLKGIIIKQNERWESVSIVNFSKMKLISDLLAETYMKATVELNAIFKWQLNPKKYEQYRKYNKARQQEIEKLRNSFDKELDSVADEIGLLSKDIKEELGDIDFLLDEVREGLGNQIH